MSGFSKVKMSAYEVRASVTEAIYTMSRKELDRVKVIQQVLEKCLSQKHAAKQLGVTDRQVRRLIKRFHEKGETRSGPYQLDTDTRS